LDCKVKEDIPKNIVDSLFILTFIKDHTCIQKCYYLQLNHINKKLKILWVQWQKVKINSIY